MCSCLWLTLADFIVLLCEVGNLALQVLGRIERNIPGNGQTFPVSRLHTSPLSSSSSCACSVVAAAPQRRLIAASSCWALSKLELSQ